ncbi:cupin domain-containing protein [Tumidithrix elongata RA019]|uniref:Cupin domain-containing protein n=1 Tax=Tumidithrix elongata BACA0141 TaxID=2716417 RepID=A0AAW9Q4C2_9CYAN|nr:cupin domain-containing protein [Tumidithrix elongata RA019]
MTIIDPSQVPSRIGTNYPDLFKSVVAGREKKRLGDAAGLKNFGVNLTTLPPKSRSALRHWHTKQDEFIYVLSGELTLITDEGETILQAGQAAGFPAGLANGHCLYNHSEAIASYLEIGDRTPDDCAAYPDDDLVAKASDQGWQFTHKDGTPYSS